MIKLVFIKNFRKIAAFTVLFAVMLKAAGFSYAEENYQASLERVYMLETSYDPDRYVKFKTEGDIIYTEGYFKNATVIDFYISTKTMRNIQSAFELKSDGTFKAYFGGIPPVENARAVIKFEDGRLMAYRVEYDGGWFFGDNGLSGKTARAVALLKRNVIRCCAGVRHK